jgi:hypothetical protein
MSKAAFAKNWVSSVDLAKHAGLWIPEDLAKLEHRERHQAKLAIIGKLSEIEKEIESKLTPIDTQVSNSMEDSALDEDDTKKLKKVGLSSAMATLHNAQILLPVKDFLKLLSHGEEGMDDIAEDVQSALPNVFSRMKDDQDDNAAFDGDGPTSDMLDDVIGKLLPSLGMGEIPLGKRITVTIIRGRSPKKAHARDTSPEIESLAKLYATYKLAFITHPRNQSSVLTRAIVLQNYTNTRG